MRPGSLFTCRAHMWQVAGEFNMELDLPLASEGAAEDEAGRDGWKQMQHKRPVVSSSVASRSQLSFVSCVTCPTLFGVLTASGWRCKAPTRRRRMHSTLLGLLLGPGVRRSARHVRVAEATPWPLQCGFWRTCLQEAAEHVVHEEASWAGPWLLACVRRWVGKEPVCQAPDERLDSWCDIMEVLGRTPAFLGINSCIAGRIGNQNLGSRHFMHTWTNKYVTMLAAWMLGDTQGRGSGMHARHCAHCPSFVRLQLTQGCRAVEGSRF